jgi:hypothetical protein
MTFEAHGVREQLVGRGSLTCDSAAGDEPERDRRAALEPRPRSSGMRLTKLKR